MSLLFSSLLANTSTRNLHPKPPSNTSSRHLFTPSLHASLQGIIGQLSNASFSVVSNQDYDGRFTQMSLACRVIVAAAKVLAGQTLDFHCYS